MAVLLHSSVYSAVYMASNVEVPVHYSIGLSSRHAVLGLPGHCYCRIVAASVLSLVSNF